MIRLLIALVAAVAMSPLQAETLRLAVTTSFNNSGLAEVLMPEISSDLGFDVQLLVVGSGQALALGRAGDVDALLVHSRVDEEAFIAAGYGTHRRKIMYNDFVFIGPEADPAAIAEASSAAGALARISQSQSAFISRGDLSGTHQKELALWQVAGMQPMGGWYRAAGAGMGATLNIASAMGAYAMTDRASWLNFGNKATLILLYAGDPALFNQYSFIPVNPARHRHINHAQAVALERWLTSDKAAELINGHTFLDAPLFIYNAVVQ